MLIGIDEVGRGCWAGPLVAAAVALNEPIIGLRDSKRLSANQRTRLSAIILEQAEAYGIGWVTPAELDHVGLTQAVRLAMERALMQITKPYQQIVIDGNLNFLAHLPHTSALIKADDSVPAVSAASIIAKVARDNYMKQISAEYPHYGFEQHVGYGTKQHQLALQQFGVTKLHRRSFKPVQALL